MVFLFSNILNKCLNLIQLYKNFMTEEIANVPLPIFLNFAIIIAVKCA
jgi:uncharacterized membrane protein YhfC